MTCFSKDTVAFLMENRFRDSRDWFREHREDYLRLVLEPFQALVEALAPTLLKIDGRLITEPKVDRTISRVYRDTRFSKDKSLYRENMWCVFMRDKKLYHGPPAFYFELTPESFSWGCGYYQASPKELAAMRELILEATPSFAAAKRFYDAQDLFVLTGERYKRSKHPDQPPDLRDWLDRRGISFNTVSKDFDLLFSQDLAPVVGDGFRKLKPVYEFFLDAHGRTRRD